MRREIKPHLEKYLKFENISNAAREGLATRSEPHFISWLIDTDHKKQYLKILSWSLWEIWKEDLLDDFDSIKATLPDYMQREVTKAEQAYAAERLRLGSSPRNKYRFDLLRKTGDVIKFDSEDLEPVALFEPVDLARVRYEKKTGCKIHWWDYSGIRYYVRFDESVYQDVVDTNPEP